MALLYAAPVTHIAVILEAQELMMVALYVGQSLKELIITPNLLLSCYKKSHLSSLFITLGVQMVDINKQTLSQAMCCS